MRKLLKFCPPVALVTTRGSPVLEDGKPAEVSQKQFLQDLVAGVEFGRGMKGIHLARFQNEALDFLEATPDGRGYMLEPKFAQALKRSADSMTFDPRIAHCLITFLDALEEMTDVEEAKAATEA